MARTFVKGSDIASATIATGNLMDSAVTTAKIAGLNVTAAKLAADSVETAKIVDAAVTTAKVADAAITLAKLAADSVDASKIAAGAVGTSELADASATAAKLAADSVETAKILDGNVTTAKLAANAVTPAKADLASAWTFSDLRGTFGADVDVKQSVAAIARANITLSGPQTIDGVALTAGQRVLVAGQTTGSENGIYVVAAGSWARSADMPSGSDAAGAFTFVEQGTVNADSGWVCTNDKGAAVVGTDSLAFSQFSGAGSIVAGDGLAKVGNTLNVNVGPGVQILSDAVQLKLTASNPGLSADGSGVAVLLNSGASGFARPAIEVTGAGLAIKVDDSTVDANGSGQLRVKGLGIGAAQLAAGSTITFDNAVGVSGDDWAVYYGVSA